jgi:hypothetical protein
MIKKIRINENEEKASIVVKYDKISSVMDAFRTVRDALRKKGFSTEEIASAIIKAKPESVDDALDIMEKYVDIKYV